MPLPEPGPREELHARDIQLRGYRRPDGLYEVEGRLLDRKTTSYTAEPGAPTVQPGKPSHHMSIRLVFDEDLLVHDAIAATDAAPYGECFGAPPTLECMRGVRIAAGWTRAVRERLGGVKSCTHLMELLLPMGTAAFQSISLVRLARPVSLDAVGRPVKIDSCYAYSARRGVVARRWPEHALPADAD